MSKNSAYKNRPQKALHKRLDALAAEGKLDDLIIRLPDERHKMLIFLRHGKGLKWASVCGVAATNGLFYSQRQMLRLYAAALKQIESLLEETE